MAKTAKKSATSSRKGPSTRPSTARLRMLIPLTAEHDYRRLREAVHAGSSLVAEIHLERLLKGMPKAASMKGPDLDELIASLFAEPSHVGNLHLKTVLTRKGSNRIASMVARLRTKGMSVIKGLRES